MKRNTHTHPSFPAPTFPTLRRWLSLVNFGVGLPGAVGPRKKGWREVRWKDRRMSFHPSPHPDLGRCSVLGGAFGAWLLALGSWLLAFAHTFREASRSGLGFWQVLRTIYRPSEIGPINNIGPMRPMAWGRRAETGNHSRNNRQPLSTIVNHRQRLPSGSLGHLTKYPCVLVTSGPFMLNHSYQ